ncbi:MAG: DUF1439 domain-containing protein [Gallionellaceae bacterium]|jgi:hypothetical protein
MKLRESLQKLFLLLTLLVLSACAALVPKEHLIPKEKLVSLLNKKFPIQLEEAGGLLSFKIDAPRLNFITEQNRISIKGHYTADATLLKIKGDFVFSSKLDYHKEKRAIFLSDARFESFHPSGGYFADKLRSALNRKVSEFVSNNPLYVFRPDQLVILGVKMEVNKIEVVNDGILIKLNSAK